MNKDKQITITVDEFLTVSAFFTANLTDLGAKEECIGLLADIANTLFDDNKRELVMKLYKVIKGQQR